jgi:hypothetical protein
MNEAVCLYCEKPERNYKPSKGVDFICSRCVMAFLSADQDYLKWVHDRAIKNSMPDKARAIESFIWYQTSWNFLSAGGLLSTGMHDRGRLGNAAGCLLVASNALLQGYLFRGCPVAPKCCFCTQKRIQGGAGFRSLKFMVR